jgi:UDP-N-acetylmuramoyl-tripeptide--D-alanyl-D-alanine ligase
MSAVIPRSEDRGFWTLDRIARALGTGPHGSRQLGAIVTDSRAVERGDVFVALVGERFDGHSFIRDVIERGAAAVVVSRPPAIGAAGVPVFEVPDTLVALGLLAREWRRAWGKTVIGIAGSNGKTSTKELLAGMLSSRLAVAATRGNLNNRIGVPLTLLAVPASADVAVIEIGTNLPGEVAILRDVACPNIAIVTSIAEEHLEGLGDLNGVLREEASVFDGVELGIIPSDLPELEREVRSRARAVVTTGLGKGDIQAHRWEIDSRGQGLIEVDGVSLRPPLKGRQNLANTVLAWAAARACGLTIEDAARGLSSATVPSMRMTIEPLGRATLINDAYNANPGSVRAAIDELSRAEGPQRVAILGTMRELGAASERCHDEAAQAALASRADVLAGLGEFGDAFRRLAPDDQRVIVASDIDDLWPSLRDRLHPDAVILLKGSRGVRLERLVPLLTDWAGST